MTCLNTKTLGSYMPHYPGLLNWYLTSEVRPIVDYRT